MDENFYEERARLSQKSGRIYEAKAARFSQSIRGYQTQAVGRRLLSVGQSANKFELAMRDRA
jgi:hypothetical protein